MIHSLSKHEVFSRQTITQLPVLITQGNLPVATAVAMTHFVVAGGGPPEATRKWVITGKTTGLRSRTIEKPLEKDIKLPKNHWFESKITKKLLK